MNLNFFATKLLLIYFNINLIDTEKIETINYFKEKMNVIYIKNFNGFGITHEMLYLTLK